MPQEPAFRASLAALSEFFIGDKTMHETLHRVAEAIVRAVPSAEFVGITMMSHGKPHTGVFTDPASPQIDQAQYDNGSGPCLAAFRTGQTYRIDSSLHDTRWPEFNRACLDHGILSTLSIPLTVDSQTNGTLKMYSASETAFTDEDRRTASLFAAQAAIVLSNAFAYWGARAQSEQLERALNTRAVIEQAKGIIMSTMRCNADQAFRVLVVQSQRENRTLAEIAAAIVRQTTHRP